MRKHGIRYAGSMFCVVLSLLSLSCEKVKENQVADIDGNIYETITIGDQVWMAENLRTARLNDGTAIQPVIEDKEWEYLTAPGYCWYGNYEAFFSLNHYGALYNSYAVSSGKLCPAGWHVPDDKEWRTLELFLGPGGGGKLKETGSMNWLSPNTGATNETGFNALPGGVRSPVDFQKFRKYAYFWSSSVQSAWNLNYFFPNLINGTPNQSSGLSVRCIKN